MYCSEPAETDGLVAAEPLWCCSLCGGACHVSCFAAAHPQLPSVGAKLHELLEGKSGGGGGQGGGGRQQRQRRQGKHGSSSMLSSSPSGGSSSEGEQGGLLSPAAADPEPAEPSSAVSDSSAPEGLRQRRGSSTAVVDGTAAEAHGTRQQGRARSASWLQALAGMVQRSSSAGGAAGRGGMGSGGSGSGGGGTAAAAAASESGYSSDTESGG